ncbi:MAG TPA: Maf family protein [Solirubrobacterales bacterium]|nr:Maf family protein [Solirubrobacterales bacterium]
MKQERLSKVVLASRSPQRRALLEALGVDIEVAEPMIEELTEGDPREIVLENARWKAAAVAATTKPGTLVVGGDTEVVLDGEALGQPEDAEQARAMLERLSGREHEVLGGLALLGPEEEEEGTPRTREGIAASAVRFRPLGAELIAACIATGEWEGRAGAYAIQGVGSMLVEQVSGDLSNVIGLPIPLLLELEPRFQSV